MSDLEDDLLALAGGDSSSEADNSDASLKRTRNDSSFKKRARLSSGGKSEESEGDDEEDGFDPEVDVKFGGRGGSETVEKGFDENIDDVTNDSLTNPYPLEGKYRDEDDRESLLAMDEVQREQMLFEREQEMDRYNENKYLQQRMKQQKAHGVETKTRSSSRKVPSAPGKLSKSDKLSELRKQREQRTKRQEDDYEDASSDESADNAGGDEELSDAYEEEERVVWGAGKSMFQPRAYVRATVADINKIRVGRSFLGKYLYYKDFAMTVAHTFGKINVGVDRRTRRPIYRAVQIEEAVFHPHKTYKMGEGKTDMYLLVSQNKAQKKEFPLSVFSDADISAEEFDRYIAELAKLNEEVPYADDVSEKAEELHRLMNSGLSNKDIDEMVSRKQKMQKGTYAYDAVYQKSKVMDELKVARQENNRLRIQQLTEDLRKLEEILYKDSTRNSQSSSTSMSKVNERNRKLNQTNIRKAEVKSSMLRKTADADEGDPFSRLKTTTRIFYQDLVNEENQKALHDAQANFDSMIAEKNEHEAKIASSTYRVLGNFDKLVAQVEVEFVPQLD